MTRAKTPKAATPTLADINSQAMAYLLEVMNDKTATAARRDHAADRLLMFANKGKTTKSAGLKTSRVEDAQQQIDSGGSKFAPARAPTVRSVN